MPDNGELGRNTEGKRNNRAVEESGKGRENETVETRSLEKRKLKSTTVTRERREKGERDRRGRVRQKRSKER